MNHDSASNTASTTWSSEWHSACIGILLLHNSLKRKLESRLAAAASNHSGDTHNCESTGAHDARRVLAASSCLPTGQPPEACAASRANGPADVAAWCVTCVDHILERIGWMVVSVHFVCGRELLSIGKIWPGWTIDEPELEPTEDVVGHGLGETDFSVRG